MTVDENDHEEIKLPGRNNKFKKVPTIHKKYAERPSSLDDVCLGTAIAVRGGHSAVGQHSALPA